MGSVESRKGGRKRRGTLEPAGTHADGSPRFRFRLRLADGTKSERLNVPHGLNEEQARAHVAGWQADEDARGVLLADKQERARKAAAERQEPHDLETANDWFARYLKTKECGETHRRISSGVWTKWIAPVIGMKAMRSLTRDDVEDVRDKLDAAIDARTIRHSTARNTWGVLTGALKAAYAARDRSLRVLSAPLYFGVLPPKRGGSRQRPWLYPREWVAFVQCETIPVEWRQACALALYTGLRPGELHALLWSDVDLVGRTISVSKALDGTGATKAPKTLHGQRTIPIHEHLLPMLARQNGAAHDFVFPFALSDVRLATNFRAYLKAAKIDRVRLEANNATEEPIDFRSLRDTHATWLALAGVPDRVIQRRMGHASPTTTDRYVKAAESFDRDGVGEPFPTLPKAVWSSVWPRSAKTSAKGRGFSAPAVGLEPILPENIAGTPPPISEDVRSDPSDTPATKSENGEFGPTFGPTDAVETALAKALESATAAQRWDVVAQLARELEARRLAAAKVVTLAERKRGAK